MVMVLVAGICWAPNQGPTLLEGIIGGGHFGHIGHLGFEVYLAVSTHGFVKKSSVGRTLHAVYTLPWSIYLARGV